MGPCVALPLVSKYIGRKRVYIVQATNVVTTETVVVVPEFGN